jgi:hypothetical protein
VSDGFEVQRSIENIQTSKALAHLTNVLPTISAAVPEISTTKGGILKGEHVSSVNAGRDQRLARRLLPAFFPGSQRKRAPTNPESACCLGWEYES